MLCPNITTIIDVQGYYRVSDTCEIRTTNLTTLSNNFHMIKDFSLTPYFSHFNLSFDFNTSLIKTTSYKGKFLNLLNDTLATTSLSDALIPKYLDHTVVFPLFVIPALILITCLIVFLFCIRRVYRRYKILTRQVRKENTNEMELQTTSKQTGVESSPNEIMD